MEDNTKKTITIVLVLIAFIFTGNIRVNAQSEDSITRLNKINNDEVEVINYVNNKQMKSVSLNDKQTTFIYNLENDGENEPLAQFVINFEGKTFIKTFYSDEKDVNKKANDIVQYFNELEDQIISSKKDFFTNVFGEERNIILKTNASEEWTFNPTVYSSQMERKPYGKFVVTVKTYEQIAEGHYFTRVESTVEFVLGIAAKASGASGYENYFIDEGGTRHNIRLSTTRIDNSGTYSEPRGIDYWPTNGNSSYTVTSAWGLSGTIGYSQKDKFNGSITADFQRATSYTEESPKLSATTVTPFKEYSWVYNTHKKGNNQKVTQHHTGNVLVEQKMNDDSRKSGVFEVNNELYMKVDRGIFYKEQIIRWGYSMANLGGYLL